MLKMSKNTVTAQAFLPGRAYKSAVALATAHNGEIGTTAEGRFTAKFKTTKIAKQFKLDWETAYEANRKLLDTPTPTDKGKGKKADKKSKPSSSKKGNSKKMTLDDFIINNPSCTREEAKAYGFKGTRAELKARKKKLGVR